MTRSKRTKALSQAQAALDAAAVEAVEALRAMLREGSSEAVRERAANSILDRALGKPPTRVDLASEQGGTVEIKMEWDAPSDI